MKTTLRKQLEVFKQRGVVIDSEGSYSCSNFYDWFCKESSLEKKSVRLMKQVESFVDQFEVDVEKHYVFFKNNCPMVGPLYDDFRVVNIESGDVIWTVIPKCGHSGKAEIWGRVNEFKEPVYEADTLTKLYKSR